MARVGDVVITVDDYLMNYEFGHGHLRTGAQPKQTYLQFLIKEALLAQEARRLELDTLPVVRHAMHTLREELLIERVFEEEVLAGIAVTEDEIRAEINKDAVNFQFRLLPVDTEARGQQLRAQMLQSSFAEVMEAQLEAIPELRTVEGQLTSPYVGAEDLDAEIMQIIQDLPLQTPSEPVLYRGAWYLFEVTDIRRKRLAEEDYTLKAPSYEKIIFNRKAMDEGARFVDALMSPLDVRTHREGFELLNEALFAWYTVEPPERNLNTYADRSRAYIAQLDAAREIPLVAFDGKTWSINDFMTHFTPARYQLRADDAGAFKARLSNVVALVVRDHVLLNMAEDGALANGAGFQADLKRWEDKWLFQAYRDQVLSHPETNWQHLVAKAESLQAIYPPEINLAVLDTLQTSVSKANPTMTVHLFKNNANKMPRPIADPNWQPAL